MRRLAAHSRYLARHCQRSVSSLRRGGRGAPEGAVTVGLDSDSSTLLVAFGGLPGPTLETPAFEFMRVSRGLDVKGLFMRDPALAWYHLGTPGWGHSLAGIADALTAFRKAHHVERLVMAGSSAGGYAALAFGAALRADTVLAFAPQTTIEVREMLKLGDRRWQPRLSALASAGLIDGEWADLRRAILRQGSKKSIFNIYYDETLALDRAHAERLAEVPGVWLHPRAAGGHSLVRELRDGGELVEIVGRAAAPGSARALTR